MAFPLPSLPLFFLDFSFGVSFSILLLGHAQSRADLRARDRQPIANRRAGAHFGLSMSDFGATPQQVADT